MNIFANRGILLLIISTSGFFSFCFAQPKVIHFTILTKRDSVGNMLATQKISGDDVVYSVASIVEIKMLITVKVVIQEEAHYHKEKLILSTSKRIVNNRLKGNKQTKAVSDAYITTDDGDESRLNQKNIGYDIPSLYFKEPVGISRVYSDYYQKMVLVKTIGSHAYQIDLPEGGSNIYYYENGACKKVDIRGTFFNGQMILSR